MKSLLMIFLPVVALAGLWKTDTRQETVTIAIVNQPVVRGTVFTPDRVTGATPVVQLVEWPAALVPSNAISNVQDIIGKIAKSDMPTRTPVLATNLVDETTQLSRIGSDVALFTSPGNLAVPLDLRILTVAGVQPFSCVDVVGMFDFGEDIVAVFMLGPGAEVVEIGQKNIIVSVLPEHIVTLVWAQDMGIPLSLQPC